ncbi:larval cuticle protein LCP-30-like isoform X1 [Chrysoperla carnea]|uniref:larval cuticle protein LCP-30-like isoform X1 n=1 Tax=Chrysoperla carnea TaxID=189513 RepID=UPI001D0966A6|nr:larval cuticle protein LCP-30-like isoform X1 [Chrysoperla carnea]
MLKLVVFVIFALLSVAVFGQNDGRYRPEPSRLEYPSIPLSPSRPGQYRPDPGRYIPDNSGRYNNDDGKYRPDDSGKYSGKADPYKYVDVGGGKYKGSKDIILPYKDFQGPGGPSYNDQYARGQFNSPAPIPTIPLAIPSIPSSSLRPGQYRQDPGRYRPDNSGRYNNDDGKYRPDDSGKYSGKVDPYKYVDVGGGKYKGSKDIIPPYKDIQGPGGPSNNDQSARGRPNPLAPIAPKAPSTPRPPLNIIYVSGPGIGDINSQYTDAYGQSTLGLPIGLEQGNAAGLYDNRNYRIIVDEKQPQRDGDYHYKYETENRIFGEETGKQVGSGDDAGADATGYYKYTGPDNIVYTVNYHAGEEGFEPEAVHIPTPPPIPELILRSLKYQREAGELDNESIFVYLANSN